MGFGSGLIAGHFRTLQRFVLNHFRVLFEVCFGSLSCWKTHDLWFMGPCTVKASGARSSKATPTYLWTSTMFDRRDRVLFFEGHISFSVHSTIMCFTKKLYFGLICPDVTTWRSPRRILASSGKFWQTLVWLFYVSVSAVGSFWVSEQSVPFHSDGDR